MADLGFVGQQKRKSLPIYTTSLPSWGTKGTRNSVRVRAECIHAWSGAYPLLSTVASGNLRGTTKQDGAILPFCRVALYYRPSLQLVDTQLSKADGTFRFDNLLAGIDIYFVVALDPDGAPNQNAIILDKLTPT